MAQTMRFMSSQESFFKSSIPDSKINNLVDIIEHNCDSLNITFDNLTLHDIKDLLKELLTLRNENANLKEYSDRIREESERYECRLKELKKMFLEGEDE